MGANSWNNNSHVLLFPSFISFVCIGDFFASLAWRNQEFRDWITNQATSRGNSSWRLNTMIFSFFLANRWNFRMVEAKFTTFWFATIYVSVLSLRFVGSRVVSRLVPNRIRPREKTSSSVMASRREIKREKVASRLPGTLRPLSLYVHSTLPVLYTRLQL